MKPLISWLQGRKKDQPDPSPPPSNKDWYEDELTQLDYTLGGLRLGMTSAEAKALITEELVEETPFQWAWGEHGMNCLRFVDGRVRELWGTQLEYKGEVIARQGEDREVLEKVDLPSEVHGFRGYTECRQLFELEPFVLSASIVTEDALYSPEHHHVLGTKDVVDKIFQISLGFREQ